MESLIELLGTGASVASGGVFGLLGSAIGVFAKVKQEKLRQIWQQQEWDHEERLLDKQIQAAKSETENEIAIASAQGSWSGLGESIRADAIAQADSGLAKDIKALFRPFLTTMLVICSMYIFHMLYSGGLSNVFDDNEITAMLRYTVYSIVFSTCAAITWWFGDRALTPSHLKHR